MVSSFNTIESSSVYLFTAVRPKSWWPFGTRDCAYLQIWQGKVQQTGQRLDKQICNVKVTKQETETPLHNLECKNKSWLQFYGFTCAVPNEFYTWWRARSSLWKLRLWPWFEQSACHIWMCILKYTYYINNIYISFLSPVSVTAVSCALVIQRCTGHRRKGRQ